MTVEELEAAFSVFADASEKLTLAYNNLQSQVASLTTQLEIANGNLKRELAEKAALSARLSTLLEHLPAGVVELDADGGVVAMNPAASTYLRDLAPSISFDAYVEGHLLHDAVADLWVRRSDSGERRLAMHRRALPDECNAIVLVHDVTENWQLQQSLAQHRRLAAMGEMAASLAHQLRTPLATALLYSGHLTRPELAEADRMRFAEKSLGRMRHLEALVQNMLSFVRGQQLASESVDMANVLHEVDVTFAPLAAAKTVAFDAENQLAGVFVLGDAKELAGILINLLENALQATPAQGKIVLAGCCIEGEVELRVRDSGGGMTPDCLEKLFQPFFTTRPDGTGLGLAIVQNVVSQLGGRITVASELGKGSEFTVRLPMLPAPAKV
ncbi:sensor histidine kinase [Chitinibacteraceae bacterium HSL-7]